MTNTTRSRWQVGQTVYKPRPRKHWDDPKDQPAEYDELVVKTVGRKWVTFQQRWSGRCCRDSARFEGYNNGCAYFSKEEHQEHQNELALQAAWTDLRRSIDSKYYAPEHLTLAEIQDIIKKLTPSVTETE